MNTLAVQEPLPQNVTYLILVIYVIYYTSVLSSKLFSHYSTPVILEEQQIRNHLLKWYSSLMVPSQSPFVLPGSESTASLPFSAPTHLILLSQSSRQKSHNHHKDLVASLPVIWPLLLPPGPWSGDKEPQHPMFVSFKVSEILTQHDSICTCNAPAIPEPWNGDRKSMTWKPSQSKSETLSKENVFGSPVAHVFIVHFIHLSVSLKDGPDTEVGTQQLYCKIFIQRTFVNYRKPLYFHHRFVWIHSYKSADKIHPEYAVTSGPLRASTWWGTQGYFVCLFFPDSDTIIISKQYLVKYKI